MRNNQWRSPGNVTDAESYLERSLLLDPLNANTLENLGEIYEAEKKYSKAKDFYWRTEST